MSATPRRDAPAHDFLLPFARWPDDERAPALPPLPNLARLLERLPVQQRDEGDEYSLSPPHERALARSLGFEGPDGGLPFAAHAAAADGIDTGDLAWGLLSPVHWQVGREHLTMGDPDALGLDEAASRAFLDAVRGLFESEGWLVAWGAPTRWYVAHESLTDLACASPDRVIGRNPDLWMPDHPAARTLRRLQAEVQMLLYTHPLNDEREARGLDPVNSFWLSGCGLRQPVREPAPITMLDALRTPALRSDAPAWLDAWRALDAGPLAELLSRAQRGEAVTLTLCGERSAVHLGASAGGSWWQRLRARLAAPRADLGALLASL
ncbi:hypothetical protein [Caldimonas sp. KR1-144]|uniref:hypothetical protein n=1 Tax=Caldimonas sp. KR1-144 TaxID=3400911 RepID=UPI003C07513E